MKHIKTMALVINEDTYAIAVACLPDEFCTIVPEDAFGSVLIINELESVRRHMNVRYGMQTSKTDSFVSLTNFWMPFDLFEEEYKHVASGRRSPLFNEVAKRSSTMEDSVFYARPSSGFRGRPRIVNARSEFPDVDED